MSITLYNISNYYQRLVNYFARMCSFEYIISPTALDRTTINEASKKNIYIQYNKAKKYLEHMNIPHLFGRILTTVFREDVYFGYKVETKDSFDFMDLDPSYCLLTYRVDQCWGFAFDFSYFATRQDILEYYPQEFQEKYRIYNEQGGSRYQNLDDKNSICIKYHEDLTYMLPPFARLFGDIADIQDYKDLVKTKSENNNTKIIHFKIPYNTDTGEYIMDKDIADQFYWQAVNNTPDYIGIIANPFDATDITTNKSATTETDEVQMSEDTMWRNAGVNPIIFGGGSNPSAAAAQLSVICDEVMVFGVVEQVQQNINRLLKNLSGTQKFNVEILKMTYFDRVEYFNMVLKAGEYGQPTRSLLNSSVGLTPANMEGLQYLENNLLMLQDDEIPLTSSHTQSSTTDEGGRPSLAEKGGVADTGSSQQDSGDEL